MPDIQHSVTPKTSRKSWARDTGWLLGANVSKTAGLLLFLVVLARLTNTEIVGEYALALAITAPVFVFAQFGLKGIFLTHKVVFPFGTYLWVQLIGATAATLVSVCIGLLTSREFALTVLLVALIKSVDSITDVFAGPLQQYEQTAHVFIGSGASSLLAAGVATGALVLGSSLNLALAFFAVTTLVTAAPTMWRRGLKTVRTRVAHGHARAENHWRNIWHLLRAGVPVGLSGALIALVATLPQYFLSIYAGPSAVAHFAVFFYTIALADIFLSTLTQSWIPRAREALSHPGLAPHGFFRFMLRTTVIWSIGVAFAALVGIAAAGLVIPAIFGEGFELTPTIALPIWISIVAMPLVAFTNIGTIVRNLYLHTIWLSLTAAVVSLVACSLLIPPLGIAGAFWSLLLASFARSIPTVYLLRSVERRALPAQGSTR